VIRITFATACVAALSLWLAACTSSPRSGPYASLKEESRDSALAQRLTLQATEIMYSDPDEAERLLREALTADLWSGPAHNDLGVVLLHKSLLYEAASEFEWARKLMPGHPDPRMNLALTLERAGRIDEALATYDTALEVYSTHVPTMQALCRLRVRTNQVDDRTLQYLRQIALEGENAQWRSWAQEQLTLASATESHSRTTDRN
jgi:Flp pilus assembly protein TadD